MAGTMTRFEQLSLIHVTDGAPRIVDASTGFTNRDDMARARIEERDLALQAALAAPVRKLRYSFIDGEVLEELDALTDRLTADLMFAEVVITHPFEGGHIDHDSCSVAVQRACDRLMALVGWAPERLEFAGYYSQRGQVRVAGFSDHPNNEELHIDLSPSARWRREMAFACYRSQEGNLRYFNVAKEAFRVAPRYDFSIAPVNCLYGELEKARFRRAVMDSDKKVGTDIG